VNVTTIGKSSEKRDIKLVTVNGERGLPKIFMDAGIHARHTTPRVSGNLCS
jgi:murein tripeptide amidase MpaA